MKGNAVRILLLAFVALLPFAGRSQQTSTAHRILQDIASLQIKEGNNKGLFPSLREYAYRRGTFKEDDNIFFTALIVWTLRRMRPSLDEQGQKLAQSIIDHASPAYSLFQNARGRNTYNFWKTNPPEIFPNGGWLNIFNRAQALPDDLDDTAIVLLAMDADSATVALVHTIMQDFANRGSRAKAAPKSYRALEAYSTWFGKKMPVDLDACVLSNILMLINHYHLSKTSVDTASAHYLSQMIKEKDYLKKPDLVSPHYQRSAVILYHLARLMEVEYNVGLDSFKHQLISDAKKLFESSDDLMDKILLSSALLRWGSPAPRHTLQFKQSFESTVTESRFVFFVANMASMFSYPVNKVLGRSGVGRFNYYCPAYNYTLILENLLLANNVKTP